MSVEVSIGMRRGRGRAERRVGSPGVNELRRRACLGDVVLFVDAGLVEVNDNRARGSREERLDLSALLTSL